MITNVLELPQSLMGYAEEALEPGQFVYWEVEKSNELIYGTLGEDTDFLTAHLDFPERGLFYAKGWTTGKLYTWHGRRLDGTEFTAPKADRTKPVVKPHITQDFDYEYA